MKNLSGMLGIKVPLNSEISTIMIHGVVLWYGSPTWHFPTLTLHLVRVDTHIQ